MKHDYSGIKVSRELEKGKSSKGKPAAKVGKDAKKMLSVKPGRSHGMDPNPDKAKVGSGKYAMGSANASKCTKKM